MAAFQVGGPWQDAAPVGCRNYVESSFRRIIPSVSVIVLDLLISVVFVLVFSFVLAFVRRRTALPQSTVE